MTAPTLVAETDMMGREVDPLAHIKRGDIVRAVELRPNGGDPCSLHYHPLGNCGRTHRHPAHWQHIAVSDGYYDQPQVVLAVWSEDAAMDMSDAPAELEGEETPLLEIKPGTMCRFRNRRDTLMILGRTHKGADTVEALNLTRQRFCRLKVDRLMERKPTDPTPTPEQMAWVAEFLADRKHAIGQIGQREVQSRRWTRSEMERSLAKADLTPPPLRYSGRVDIGINAEFPPGEARPTDTQIQKWVTEALAEKLAELSTDKITFKSVVHAIGAGLVAS